MPTYNGKVISPDDAAKAGVCPECAADLTGKNVIAHAEDHWPGELHPGTEYDEARRRKAMLVAMAPKKEAA